MRFTSLFKALHHIKKNPTMSMWGGVVVNGKEYVDNEMKQLTPKSIAGWKFVDGMTVDMGANIFID